MYVMCPRLSLNVSDNLARFKSKGRLVSGLHENGFLGFDFGNESYKVSLSEILPYLWDEGWIDYLSGYRLNGSLVFFPAVTIEITGADVKCVDCIPGRARCPFDSNNSTTLHITPGTRGQLGSARPLKVKSLIRLDSSASSKDRSTYFSTTVLFML